MLICPVILSLKAIFILCPCIQAVLPIMKQGENQLICDVIRMMLSNKIQEMQTVKKSVWFRL